MRDSRFTVTLSPPSPLKGTEPPECCANDRIFSESTGNTQGIRFGIMPPAKASARRTRGEQIGRPAVLTGRRLDEPGTATPTAVAVVVPKHLPR